MAYIFGFRMKKYQNPKRFMNFGGDLCHLKGKTTPNKCPFCHFLDPQEAVLGELISKGENGHQIQKFHFS